MIAPKGSLGETGSAYRSERGSVFYWRYKALWAGVTHSRATQKADTSHRPHSVSCPIPSRTLQPARPIPLTLPSPSLSRDSPTYQRDRALSPYQSPSPDRGCDLDLAVGPAPHHVVGFRISCNQGSSAIVIPFAVQQSGVLLRSFDIVRYIKT
jgi:hypothetical protein